MRFQPSGVRAERIDERGPSPFKGNQQNPELVAAILERFRNGMGQAETAKVLGVTKGVVSGIIHRHATLDEREQFDGRRRKPRMRF